MKFPSIEQYGQALQFPSSTILDDKLRMGTVQEDQLGLPWGRSGAFALTFKITTSGKAHAFRCFQSQRDRMHERYEAISAFLATTKINGFVKFTYLDDGIKVQQNNYPAVIMDWAQGLSLGAYVEQSLGDTKKLEALRDNIAKLALALEYAGIAHGDIQSQNMLIDATGGITLIDYDGMYVPAIGKLSAIESGHRNFQHPQREKLLPFDASLDRFAFALIYTALSALIQAPELWDEYKCHPEKLLFTSNDLEIPNTSKLFKRLKTMTGMSARATQLQAITSAKYSKTPRFSEYLNGSTPKVQAASNTVGSRPVTGDKSWYMNPDGPSISTGNAAGGEGPIVDARKAKDVRSHAGSDVQMIGKIIGVELANSGKALPHAILTLLDEQSLAVDVAIWAEGIKAFAKEGITVDETWENHWISVNGALSAELGSSSGPYIRMVVSRVNQLERITHQKATYLIRNGTNRRWESDNESRIEEEAITRNESLISGLTGGKKKQNKNWASTVTTPPPAKSTTSPSQGNTVVPTLWNRGWVPLLWALAIFGVVLAIAVVAMAANSNQRNTDSSDTNQNSDKQQSTPSNVFDLFVADYAGKCLAETGQIVECNNSAAALRVLDVVRTGSECRIGSEPLRRGVGVVCIVGKVTGAAASQVRFETCIEAEFMDGPYTKCFQGQRWEYSGCWEFANGAILQQRLKGEWTKVKEDIAVNNDCGSDMPWSVNFTRKASGVGVKRYRIFVPSSGVTQDITITVREG